MQEFTIKRVLDEADLYALRAFLRKETQKSKFLSIKLKLSLIESITLSEGVNKYDILLGELIREDRFGTVKLTRREEKLLHDICSVFLKLSTDLFMNEAFRGNYELLIAMLKKLHRYLDKIKERPTELLDMLIETYNHILRLLSVELAPELRDDIFNDGMQLLNRSYYKLHNIEYNMINVLIKAQTLANQIPVVRTLIQSKLATTEDENRVNWCTWYAILCDLEGIAADSVFVHQVMSSTEIFRVAYNLNKIDYDSAFALWLNQFNQNIQLNSSKQMEWDKWRFQVSLKSKDKAEIVSTGMKLLLETGSKDVYDQIKSQGPSGKAIIKQLRATAPPVLLAEILTFEKDWRALEKLIKSELDIELLIVYLPDLCTHSKKAYEIICHVIQHFMSHAAGTSCSDGLTRIIFRLDDLGFSSISKKVNNMIKTEFPKRFVRTNMGLDISY